MLAHKRMLLMDAVIQIIISGKNSKLSRVKIHPLLRNEVSDCSSLVEWAKIQVGFNQRYKSLLFKQENADRIQTLRSVIEQSLEGKPIVINTKNKIIKRKIQSADNLASWVFEQKEFPKLLKAAIKKINAKKAVQRTEKKDASGDIEQPSINSKELTDDQKIKFGKNRVYFTSRKKTSVSNDTLISLGSFPEKPILIKQMTKLQRKNALKDWLDKFDEEQKTAWGQLSELARNSYVKYGIFGITKKGKVTAAPTAITDGLAKASKFKPLSNAPLSFILKQAKISSQELDPKVIDWDIT